MSRFRETSELTALNRTAGTFAVDRPSSRLRRALVSSDRAWRVTGGRFDPRVLGDLDRLGYRGAALDEPGAEGRTVNRVDRVVQPVGSRGISVAHPIDLGGIGKGLALRWAAARLEQAGARRLPRSKRAATSSRVARTQTAGRGRSASRIRPEPRTWPSSRVSDLAVATSSIRVNRWSAGRTGRPPPARPTDRRTGERWPSSPSPSRRPIRPGPRSGPRPSSRRPSGDRERGAIARHRGMVDHRRWGARDDTRRPGTDDLGRQRGRRGR